jgi:hypothetical protein
MNIRSRLTVALALWFACVGLARAGGLLSVVTVGTDPACDFGNIQSAINSASTGPDDLTEIRVSADFSPVTLQIVDRNVTIRGSFLNCNADRPSGLKRVIAGASIDSVFRLSTTGLTPRTVILSSMVIRLGGADSVTERGGGVRVQGRVALTLANVSVSGNVSTRGGGVAVEGAFASVDVGPGTIIGSDIGLGLPGNGTQALGVEVGLGGGIYCSGGRVTMGFATIRANTSAQHGGGMYLDNCDVLINSVNEPGPPTLPSVRENVAILGNGGGIYATNGSTVFWRSVPAGALAGLLVFNRAEGRGGALYIDGASDFVGEWLRFLSNSADDRGGTIAADGNANVILEGGAGMRCGNTTTCPGIYGSRGITEGESATLIGGAIYGAGGAIIDLRQQHLFENYASNGSVMHLSGNDTFASMNGVVMTRNLLYGVGNGTSTIELTSSADMTLRHVTMGGNFRVSNQFPGLERVVSSIRANGNQSNVQLRNSTFFDDATSLIRLLVGASATGSCVLAHESASFAPAVILDPQYVNTLGEFPDFGLSDSSPARDRCAASGMNTPDVLGRARPTDIFAAANVDGAFDVGAYEVTSSDDIFRDGFELP